MKTVDSLFECELCHKNFSQKSSRNRHVREQHLQPGIYQCKECGLRFSKKYNLQNHKKHLHTNNTKKNIKQYKCIHCTGTFNKLLTLKRHLKEQHANLEINESAEESTKEGDAQTLAEMVLKELKQLQNDIQNTNEPLNKQELTAIETAVVKDITIKDNLYPGTDFKLIKVQTIKRVNGLNYFICEFCSKEFKKLYNFLRHRRIHTKIRPFICVLCKKSFATTAQLKTHCSSHKLNESLGLFHNLYKCPQCKEGFSALQQLDKHLKTTLSCSNISFQCPECLKCYKNLKTLLNHKHAEKDKEMEMLKQILPKPLTVKDNTDYYDCNLCGLLIKGKTLLKQHEQRHTNLYKYQCTECQRSYATRAALKIHTKIHTKGMKFKCHYCHKTFKTAPNCRRHMLIHLKLLIKSLDDGEDHNNTLITYPTFIENEETGQLENTEIIIIKTRKSHQTQLEHTTRRKDQLKFKCSKCDKTFRFKAWLKKHFTYKHTSERPYECKTCLKKFRTKQSLENHLVVHAKTRTKFTCQVCGRQYASTKSLKVHLRIHTQENPFKCDKCSKLFRTSGHLIQHRKSNHSKE